MKPENISLSHYAELGMPACWENLGKANMTLWIYALLAWTCYDSYLDIAVTSYEKNLK